MSSAECSALHAVIEEDPETARTILRDFSGVELSEFQRQLGELVEVIEQVRTERS